MSPGPFRGRPPGSERPANRSVLYCGPAGTVALRPSSWWSPVRRSGTVRGLPRLELRDELRVGAVQPVFKLDLRSPPKDLCGVRGIQARPFELAFPERQLDRLDRAARSCGEDREQL